MRPSLNAGIARVLERLGDGHGRRAVLLASGVDEADVKLATDLARKAWVVCVCCREPSAVERGRVATDQVGVVVDWRVGLATALPLTDGVTAAVASCADPGPFDEQVTTEIARVLQPGGLLVVALPAAALESAAGALTTGELGGFSGITVTEREGVALISARQRG